MSLKDMNVVVTGGSRGLGLGLVEALVAQGARVTVVARNPMRSRPSGPGWAFPRSPPTSRTRPPPTASLPTFGPDILALNAGAKPPMGRLDQMSWADFTAPWETRRQGRIPLAAGGAQPAAQARKPRAGGVERRGRERIADVGRLWRRQAHALVHGQVRQRRFGAEGASGIRFQAIVPRQMVLRHRGRRRGRQRLCTSHGHRTRGAFVARFGAPMPPRVFGEKVVAVLDDPEYAEGFAFGLKGDTGITMLEGLAA